MKPLNSKELKNLHKLLIEQYGYNGSFEYTVFEAAEQKYFISSRDVEQFLDKRLHIERIGIYLGQLLHGELRLSIEGSQLVGPKAAKRVIILDNQQKDDWMLGKDVVVPKETEQVFHIVKNNNDFLGCGKVKNGILINYVPKERYVGATFPQIED